MISGEVPATPETRGIGIGTGLVVLTMTEREIHFATEVVVADQKKADPIMPYGRRHRVLSPHLTTTNPFHHDVNFPPAPLQLVAPLVAIDPLPMASTQTWPPVLLPSLRETI